jgi:hypothetical protein
MAENAQTIGPITVMRDGDRTVVVSDDRTGTRRLRPLAAAAFVAAATLVIVADVVTGEHLPPIGWSGHREPTPLTMLVFLATLAAMGAMAALVVVGLLHAERAATANVRSPLVELVVRRATTGAAAGYRHCGADAWVVDFAGQTLPLSSVRGVALRETFVPSGKKGSSGSRLFSVYVVFPTQVLRVSEMDDDRERASRIAQTMCEVLGVPLEERGLTFGRVQFGALAVLAALYGGLTTIAVLLTGVCLGAFRLFGDYLSLPVRAIATAALLMAALALPVVLNWFFAKPFRRWARNALADHFDLLTPEDEQLWWEALEKQLGEVVDFFRLRGATKVVMFDECPAALTSHRNGSVSFAVDALTESVRLEALAQLPELLGVRAEVLPGDDGAVDPTLRDRIERRGRLLWPPPNA